MSKKPINLGFCPRCKEPIGEKGIMQRERFGVVWCYLCSFDMEENPTEREQWVDWAKEYKENMT